MGSRPPQRIFNSLVWLFLFLKKRPRGEVNAQTPKSRAAQQEAARLRAKRCSLLLAHHAAAEDRAGGRGQAQHVEARGQAAQVQQLAQGAGGRNQGLRPHGAAQRVEQLQADGAGGGEVVNVPFTVPLLFVSATRPDG